MPPLFPVRRRPINPSQNMLQCLSRRLRLPSFLLSTDAAQSCFGYCTTFVNMVDQLVIFICTPGLKLPEQKLTSGHDSWRLLIPEKNPRD